MSFNKVLLTTIIFLMLSAQAFSQVAINNTGAEADASAILDVTSTEKGMLVPRMTTVQRTAIASPANGLLVYDTDTQSFWHYNDNDSNWIEFVAGAIKLNDLDDANTMGSNVFIGSNSGVSNNGGDNRNTAVGYNALREITTGAGNTAMGSYALYQVTTGRSNTIIGNSSALNTNGDYNTVLGANSLCYNTTGNRNIAVGSNVLYWNTSGSNNTAIGDNSIAFNSSGSNNTSIGYYAGHGTLGNSYSGCIFLGYQAGYMNTSNNKLYIENSDSQIPLIGGDFSTDQVDINGTIKITGGNPGNGKILTSDANGHASWEGNPGATELNDLSDAKTIGNSVFIGSNSGVSNSGDGNKNTSFGYESLRDITTGVNNTALGTYALSQATTGQWNTVIGCNSAFNTNGDYNTVLGAISLIFNTTGSRNIAVGTKVLYYNTSGDNNTAIGDQAMYNNSSGGYNTAIGCSAGRGVEGDSFSGCVFLGNSAGQNNTSDNKLYIDNSSTSSPLIGGDFSTNQVDINGTIKITGGTPGNGKILTSDADGLSSWQTQATYATEINDLSDASYNGSDLFIGDGSGASNSGNNNGVVVGRDALKSNTSGDFNTAIGNVSLENNTGERNTAVGYYSMHSNSTGSFNTSLGYRTGYDNQTGSYNTFLGYNARMSSASIRVNSTAIGNEAVITASDQVRIGNSAVTSIGGQVAWTTLSDGRFKENVKEDVAGLDFVINLRPVSYTINKQAINNFVGSEYIIRNTSSPQRECGFVAQEVEQLVKRMGVEFNGVDAPENDNDYYGIRYSQFVVPLVKSVQELNEKLEKENADLRARIEKLEEIILKK